MIDRKTAKEMVEHAVEFAKGLLVTDEFLPVALMYNQDSYGVVEIGPFFEDPKRKQALPRYLAEIAKQKEAELVIVVTEGWKKDPQDTSKIIGELLMVSAIDKLGEFGTVIEFTRDEKNRPVFQEPEPGFQISCTFFELIRFGNETYH